MLLDRTARRLPRAIPLLLNSSRLEARCRLATTSPKLMKDREQRRQPSTHTSATSATAATSKAKRLQRLYQQTKARLLQLEAEERDSTPSSPTSSSSSSGAACPIPTHSSQHITNTAPNLSAAATRVVNPRGVFVNNELDLSRINVYGFDYDYTLAVYTRELNELIYRLAVQRLVREMNYPAEVMRIDCDVGFAIRGLHYDIDNYCLLKVDAFHQIQEGTVYRGRKRLSDEEVREIYGGYTLPESRGMKLPQLIDFFSLPWAGLLATLVDYLQRNSIPFDPVILYNDVAACVHEVHASGELYAAVKADLVRYVHRNVGLGDYLTRLVDGGKELFIITNSPFDFINSGMSYMLDADWRRLFKYVVVGARKPGFFQSSSPFRLYDERTGSLSYERITELEPHARVYSGGNIAEFSARAKFSKPGVLYFGDHLVTDLADPMLQLGWHTAAIVPDLAREIRLQNQPDYRRAVVWMEALTALIERNQHYAEEDPTGCGPILREWLAERGEVRERIKQLFNTQFGSMFRTYHNMTFFCARLNRLADIYTSRLPNMLHYSDKHTFFPRRNALSHEVDLAIAVEESFFEATAEENDGAQRGVQHDGKGGKGSAC